MNALEKLKKNGINLDEKTISDVVARYNIQELSVFGSSIRDDFNDNSDVDFLVVFKNSSEISLFDLMDMEDYFASKLGRKVDLVEPEGIRNPIRRKSILESKEPIYVA